MRPFGKSWIEPKGKRAGERRAGAERAPSGGTQGRMPTRARTASLGLRLPVRPPLSIRPFAALVRSLYCGEGHKNCCFRARRRGRRRERKARQQPSLNEVKATPHTFRVSSAAQDLTNLFQHSIRMKATAQEVLPNCQLLFLYPFSSGKHCG